MALTDSSGKGLSTTKPLADTTAPAPTGKGFNLDPASAIAIGTVASGFIQGIMAQRNAAKNRDFTSGQNEISRQAALEAEERARQERQQQNVQGAIGNIGNRAAQGAQAQGSALSGLASLFGGL